MRYVRERSALEGLHAAQYAPCAHFVCLQFLGSKRLRLLGLLGIALPYSYSEGSAKVSGSLRSIGPITTRRSSLPTRAIRGGEAPGKWEGTGNGRVYTLRRWKTKA